MHMGLTLQEGSICAEEWIFARPCPSYERGTGPGGSSGRLPSGRDEANPAADRKAEYVD